MTALVITGGNLLLPQAGLVEAEMRLESGRIAEIAASVSRAGAEVLEAGSSLVLPGIVDIHGDAFERQIMPRPQAPFPPRFAFLETDRQLRANGITTAYHGITVSWEPGLRSLASAQRIVDALDTLEKRLACEHRIHIRWETFAHEEMEEVARWFGRERKPLLAFNDHTTPGLNGIRKPTKLKTSADLASITPEDYVRLLDGMAERAHAVDDAVMRLARLARDSGIRMLSHDDVTAEGRRFYREIGVGIAEFPMTEAAIADAHEAGDPIVLGAPNVVRGGSHNGCLDATSAILSGRCTILASDYYYPTLLQAAFRLVGDGHLELEDAWTLVSRNPAEACGLEDRGILETGRRADVVIVSEASTDLPTVRTTIVGGRIVFHAPAFQ